MVRVTVAAPVETIWRIVHRWPDRGTITGVRFFAIALLAPLAKWLALMLVGCGQLASNLPVDSEDFMQHI
ncbi:hypothetical protein ACT691_16770 [Vibrio metschnikovii]